MVRVREKKIISCLNCARLAQQGQSLIVKKTYNLQAMAKFFMLNRELIRTFAPLFAISDRKIVWPVYIAD